MREPHRLVHWLSERAARDAGAPALREVAPGGPRAAVGYAELADRSARAAGVLRPYAGRVVLLSAPNRASLVVGLLGALRAGARALLLPADLPAPALASAARSAGAALVIGLRDDLRLQALGVPLVPLEEIERGRADAVVHSPGRLLLPTSGTTGSSKLVERTEESLCLMGRTSAAAFGLDVSDRSLVAIPLCHSYGVDQLFASLSVGAGVDLHAGFGLGAMRRALREDGVTSLPAVPVMLDALSRAEKLEAPALRRVLSAGSALPLRVFRRFEATSGLRIAQFYGATEFGSITYNDPADPDFDPLSVGAAIPPTELRVIARGSEDLHATLAPGREGQVAVRGPTLMLGYLNAPSPLRDGWWITGDLGALDARGRLRLTGRTAFMLDVGGKKVNPLEVERVLALHPAVREVVVLAGPASDTVERLIAVVVPEADSQPSEAELRRFAATQLPPHMIPRRFEVRVDPPRSPTGKILRSALAGEGGAS
jgi:long-chain acyl-CoA synthetase